MSKLRKYLPRLFNWLKRKVGAPALHVDHTLLGATVIDDKYSLKISIKNLTSEPLEILSEVFVSDDLGLLSFENLTVLNLLTSEQLFYYRRTKCLPGLFNSVRIMPYGVMDFELAEIDKSDGFFAVLYRHGVAKLDTDKCKLTVRVTGAGVPHVFTVHIENRNAFNKCVVVKQGRGLNTGPQALSLDLLDPLPLECQPVSGKDVGDEQQSDL